MFVIGYVYSRLNKPRSSGGIGRRVGLKIQSGAISVPVQVWPGANIKDLRNEIFFYGQTSTSSSATVLRTFSDQLTMFVPRLFVL